MCTRRVLSLWRMPYSFQQTADPLLWLGGCRYRQPTGQNATGLARRFSSLAGLKLILVQEMEAMQAARGGALQPLDELVAACSPPSDQLIQQVHPCPPHCD